MDSQTGSSVRPRFPRRRRRFNRRHRLSRWYRRTESGTKIASITNGQLAISLSPAEARTGVPEKDWNAAYAQALERAVADGRHPMLTKLVQADTFDDVDGDVWLEADFEFGLQRILDGIEALMAKRGTASNS